MSNKIVNYSYRKIVLRNTCGYDDEQCVADVPESDLKKFFKCSVTKKDFPCRLILWGNNANLVLFCRFGRVCIGVKSKDVGNEQIAVTDELTSVSLSEVERIDFLQIDDNSVVDIYLIEGDISLDLLPHDEPYNDYD